MVGWDTRHDAAKTVALDRSCQIISSVAAPMGAKSGSGLRQSMRDALDQAGLSQSDIVLTVATRSGRRMLDQADRNYSNITCHARGAVAMAPVARLVIDFGGKDRAVVAVDDAGLLSSFAMSGRCAAGTGKFLEVLARAVEIDLDDLGPTTLRANKKLKISAMCAAFAETEVISLLASGKSKSDGLGAVHAAIATRTLGMVGPITSSRSSVFSFPAALPLAGPGISSHLFFRISGMTERWNPLNSGMFLAA
ncbi:MAG: acyl-CoA dehydratase activase [Roseicyclus sp.]